MLKKTVCALLLTSLLLSVPFAKAKELKDYTRNEDTSIKIEYDNTMESLPYYSEYVKAEKDVPPISDSIVLKGEEALSDESTDIKTGQEKDGSVSLLMEEGRSYSWNFSLEQAGYACVYVTYIPLENNTNSITRELLFDGAAPFQESRTISFDRCYYDDGTVKKSATGDDIRPPSGEKFAWSKTGLYDAGGFYDLPLQYRLSSGNHTLTLAFISGGMKIKEIEICAPPVIPTYSEYVETLPSLTKASQENAFSKEAENGCIRNDPSIRSVCDNDALTTPYSAGDYRLNTLGDERWKSGNQWAQWTDRKSTRLNSSHT